MKIIIDTHIYLWALAKPNKIATEKRRELESLANTIYVSSITIAELMIKASLGKLTIDFDPLVLTEEMGFVPLDFSAADAVLLQTLPFHHRDPFDRMLIAQAIAQKFSIMSDDRKFERYECRLV
ncbi:MAG: type II toxin-antitoxin system VapC family toxin [Proteobacteria bacterium]|nr:type II toxin-antitoxin system VapC family toxin [Pseudomonadota bacterium]